MVQFTKTNKLILSIGVILTIVVLVLGIRKLQHPPGMALRFDNANDICVPPKNTPPKKLIHIGLGMASFYDDYNKLFIKKWKCVTGETVTIDQKPAVSGDLMRTLITGQVAPDIVTFSNPSEMDRVARESGLISASWRNEFPFDSSPFYSTVVFVVRKGNPKNIKDWNDLVKPGVTLAASNPKDCGGGRWAYTGALGYAMGPSGTPLSQDSKEFMTKFYTNFPKLYHDQGEAGAAFTSAGNTTDVLVTYEKFALVVVSQKAPVEIVVPSRTVRIDMSVGMTSYAMRDGVADIANAYIRGLYDPSIQTLIPRDFLRPRITTNVSSQLLSRFPNVPLFTRTDVFGNGVMVENAHLADGGIFDNIKKQ